MHFSPNYYFKAKNIIKADIDYSAEKNKGLLNESIIARLYDDIVDSKINDEDIIISEILFQDAVINKIGNTTDIISLTRAITQWLSVHPQSKRLSVLPYAFLSLPQGHILCAGILRSP